MIDSEKQKPLNALVNQILENFYHEVRLPRMPVKIEFTSDLYSRRLELAKTDEEKRDVEDSKNFVEGLNGAVAFPSSVSECPYILVSLSTIETLQFVSTITHELTHIHDYYGFILKEGLLSFADAQESLKFPMLYHWSEYNATRNGYKFYRSFMISHQEDFSLDEQKTHILKTEIPFQTQHLAEHLREHEDNPTLFLYGIMRYLGRFSVWQNTFPDCIDKSKFPKERKHWAYF